MSLYFSRLMLNRNAPTRALGALLDPKDADARADANHRLIWTLFGDGHDRARDFLWRADGQGRFYTLSARPPLANDLFCPPETKEFAPKLRPGDRLSFVLRANATRDQRVEQGARSRRVDVVMQLLHDVAKDNRAEQRMKLAETAANAWMKRQGAVRGFKLRDLTVQDYGTIRISRSKRTAKHGILDLTGIIEVTDPAAFLPALASGLGRAKAWGCGLMLIRRAG